MGSIHNQTGLKWEYRDETWGDSNFSYNPQPKIFSGPRKGSTTNFRGLPTFNALFALFWTPAMLSAIVLETNRYASSPLDGGGTKGGPRWEDFTVPELRATWLWLF